MVQRNIKDLAALCNNAPEHAGMRLAYRAAAVQRGAALPLMLRRVNRRAPRWCTLLGILCKRTVSRSRHCGAATGNRTLIANQCSGKIRIHKCKQQDRERAAQRAQRSPRSAALDVVRTLPALRAPRAVHVHGAPQHGGRGFSRRFTSAAPAVVLKIGTGKAWRQN